jgi:hypothetical protein
MYFIEKYKENMRKCGKKEERRVKNMTFHSSFFI